MLLRNKVQTLVLSLILALSIVSCDNSFVYDQYTELNGKWLANEPITFEYEATDTIKPYNYFVTTRLNNEYPYNNLFLIVETQFPNKQITIDTVQYQMAAADGTILGNGFSDIKESKLWFKENVPFSELGKHTFKISQAVRELGKVDGVKELKGITEIGFRIEKINNNNE
jgi:gliding motility-associated lipoprotein GldH